MFSLASKHALVTGGGSGIGRAIAHLFSRQGARVTIVDRDEKTGTWEAGELRATGAMADFVSADISDPAAVDRFAQNVLDERDHRNFRRRTPGR